MENKIIEFYRRCVFGSDYKKDKKGAKNIINWCFNNAWRDMARTLRPKESEKQLSLQQNKETRQNQIFLLKNNVKNFLDKNLNKIIKQEKPNINNLINNVCCCNTSQIEFSFGQAQKVVNMFFKYLYTFNNEICLKNELNLDYNFFLNCDCPIDNITLKRIFIAENSNKYIFERKIVKCVDKKNDKYKYLSCENKLIDWSDLLEEQYKEIQRRIDDIIYYEKKLKTCKYNCRLDFEFDWE